MIKINKNLAFFSGIFIALSLFFLFLIQKLYPLISHATYYCQTFISTHMIQVPNYINFMIFFVLFLTASVLIIRVGLLGIETQILAFSLRHKKINLIKINDILKKVDVIDKTIIINSNSLFAFCLGIRKTNIYISTGLISELNSKELEAVLLHEKYHLENHDTITQTVTSIIQLLFPFLPLVGDFIKSYRVEREIKADLFAVKKIGDSSPLVSALRKLLIIPSVEDFAIAAIADKDTLEPRIYSLMNKPYVRKKVRIKHILITLFSFAIISFIVIMPVYANEIHLNKIDSVVLCTNKSECLKTCTSDKNLNKIYSEQSVNDNSSRLFTPAY